nr:MAG TPA: hypothetical protein [Caudoviricetes sp.]
MFKYSISFSKLIRNLLPALICTILPSKHNVRILLYEMPVFSAASFIVIMVGIVISVTPLIIYCIIP